MQTIRERVPGSALAILPILIALAGCAPKQAVTEVRRSFKPVVTINQVMVGMVDHNSHILWDVALPEYAPKTDKDWHELEHAAVTLAAAGNVILIGGSGPDDGAWVAKPDWEKFTQQETDAALAILIAVEHKDLPGVVAAGNKLTDACEACHKAYKPALPAIVATPAQQPEHFYTGRGKEAR